MKTLLKLAVAGAALFGLVSCDQESEDTRTFSFAMAAYNLITSVDDDDVAFVAPVVYSFATKYPDNTITVASSSMSLPDGGSATFTTVPVQMSIKNVSVDDRNVEHITFSSSDPTQSGAKITDFNGILTQGAYAPGSVEVPGYPREYPSKLVAHFPILDYTLNESWRVRTFWSDMTFAGTTTTTYPGMTGPYTNGKIRYRVVMKTGTANSLTGKADVIFYNAKFAASEKAPEITVALKDLDLKFTKQGYTLAGTDVVPFMMEGGELVPAPSYVFNNFTFNVVGNLTQCTASYKVANVFDGQFQGVSIAQ